MKQFKSVVIVPWHAGWEVTIVIAGDRLRLQAERQMHLLAKTFETATKGLPIILRLMDDDKLDENMIYMEDILMKYHRETELSV